MGAAGEPELTLPFRAETYVVSELCEELRDLLRQAYDSVWVRGEVQRLKEHRSGHRYFELIEKGGGDEIVAKLEAVAWRRDFERIERALRTSGQELTEGHEIRCRCDLDLYPPFGRLQLVVREVDPYFSLGLLARRRRETLAALAVAGLLERNKRLALVDLPLRVALVTSADSAAYHDFLSSLRESGYGFRVLLIHAAVQGQAAEGAVASALAAVAGLEADCVALVRGGGSRTDLAVFDSRRVAEAVARCPLPVLTGLGHEIDQSIADLAAHTALKTPTKVAEHLVGRVRAAESAVDRRARDLGDRARARLGHAREAVGGIERGLRVTGLRLRLAVDRRARLNRQLAAAAGRALARAGVRVGSVEERLGRAVALGVGRPVAERRRLGDRLVSAARARLRAASAWVDGRALLVDRLSPQRTLERGFTITRDAAGTVVREAERLRPGDRLTTRFARGAVSSRVEAG